MHWTVADFVVAGVLVAGVAAAYALTVRWTTSVVYRGAVGIALAGAFLMIWANGAVGIIGSADNDANLMYAGVLAVGFIGAVVGGFRPRAMARAMCATALAQALVAVVALAGGLGAEGAVWPWDVLVSTVFFIVLWLLSAWLFRNAATESRERGLTA